MKTLFALLILIPTFSWGDIILDCKPTDPEDAAGKLIWALNLEKKDALQLKKAFMPNGQEIAIIPGSPIEVFEISDSIIYFYSNNPEKGRIEWWLDTTDQSSIKLYNKTFSPNYPDLCFASEKIQLTSQSDTMNSINTKDAIKECEDIGFKKGTDKFMNCVLELSE